MPPVTVTVQVAYLPESSTAVAVIAVVPAASAFTVPLASTVATFSLEDVQVTLLSVALSGVTVAVKVVVLPTSSVAVVVFSATPLTGMFPGVTVRT